MDYSEHNENKHKIFKYTDENGHVHYVDEQGHPVKGAGRLQRKAGLHPAAHLLKSIRKHHVRLHIPRQAEGLLSTAVRFKAVPVLKRTKRKRKKERGFAYS